MKKCGLLFLCVLFLLVERAGGAEFTLRFAHPDPGLIDNPHHRMVLEAKRLIEERSKGRINVRIYSSQQLGNDTEAVQQIQGGVLEAALVYPQAMVTFVPEIQALEIPYLFRVPHRDPDEILEKVMSGPLRSKLDGALQAKFSNVQLVALYGNQWRDFATNFPLQKVTDMRGRAIRTIPSPIQQAFIANLGGDPTIVNSSEVFTALNTGLISGADFGVMHLYSIRIEDYIKHVFVDHHVPIVCYIVANRHWLETLPEDLRVIVLGSLADAALFGTRNSVKLARDCAARFTEEHGGSIYYPTDDVLGDFRRAAEPIRVMFAEKYGREWLDFADAAIAEAAGEARKLD